MGIELERQHAEHGRCGRADVKQDEGGATWAWADERRGRCGDRRQHRTGSAGRGGGGTGPRFSSRSWRRPRRGRTPPCDAGSPGRSPATVPRPRTPTTVQIIHGRSWTFRALDVVEKAHVPPSALIRNLRVGFQNPTPGHTFSWSLK